MPRTFSVYIMTNEFRTLYIGMTNDLVRRVSEHKLKLVPGFTAKYNLTKLVYYDNFSGPRAAIAWEKRLKGWRRARKIALIEEMNPHWEDLAKEWY